MPTYETVYIVRPNTPEDQIGQIEERLEKMAKKHEGKISEAKPLGQKPIAFPMDKTRDGIYRLVRFEGKGALVAEWEQALKYNERVLRYITIRLQEAAK